MRIIVNDIAASESGALSVLKDFYQDIINRDDNNEWIFFLNEKYIEETKKIRVLTFPDIKKSWIKRLAFDFFSGKSKINRLKPDIYISMQNSATIGVNAKQFVFLHQSIPYQKEKKFSFFKKKEFKLAVYQYIIGTIYNVLFKLTNSTIIVQTEWMKKNVGEKTRNRIVKITPKITYNFSEKCEDKTVEEKNNKHFFYPASRLVYKNHEFLVKALQANNDKEIRLFLTISQEELTIDDERVVFLGKISREEVFKFYQRTILIFPSYIETFGYPLLEAQLFNADIYALDTEFAREILADYPKKIFFSSKELDIFSKKIKMEKISMKENGKETKNSIMDVIF